MLASGVRVIVGNGDFSYCKLQGNEVRQDCFKVKASLGYRVRPHPKHQTVQVVGTFRILKEKSSPTARP